MKNTIGILLIGIFIISGCSSSATNLNSTGQVGATSMSHAVETVSFHSISENEGSDLVIEDKETVFWSHREIRNLKRLDGFIHNVAHNIKDQVTVETFSKEGDPIVMDLSYDGERLFVSVNGVSRAYEEILVEERFNEHYKGTFIEYIVKDAKGEKMLVIQISPELAKNLEQ